MLHQQMREPRCKHCTDQPASKCIECQHGSELAEWREYWRWRRSQLDWTVTPTQLLYTGSGTTAEGVVLSVYDPVSERSGAINIPRYSVYLLGVITEGVKHCEARVFAPSVPRLPASSYHESHDIVRQRLEREVISKDKAMRHALRTEQFGRGL